MFTSACLLVPLLVQEMEKSDPPATFLDEKDKYKNASDKRIF